MTGSCGVGRWVWGCPKLGGARQGSWGTWVGYSHPPAWPTFPLPVSEDVGHRWAWTGACGEAVELGGKGSLAHLTLQCSPPLPVEVSHQAQRKRILITFQQKQQLEKITASRLPASASLCWDEWVLYSFVSAAVCPPALPTLRPSLLLQVIPVCQGQAVWVCPVPCVVPSPLHL